MIIHKACELCQTHGLNVHITYNVVAVPINYGNIRRVAKEKGSSIGITWAITVSKTFMSGGLRNGQCCFKL